MGYDIYSQFDIEKHKETFVNYLEVIIKKDGTVVYAVPSHQLKAAELACEELGVDRKTLDDMCPKEWYCDYLNWLLLQSGAMAVWNTFCAAPNPNPRQIAALKKLKLHGIYGGSIPKIFESEEKNVRNKSL